MAFKKLFEFTAMHNDTSFVAGDGVTCYSFYPEFAIKVTLKKGLLAITDYKPIPTREWIVRLDSSSLILVTGDSLVNNVLGLLNTINSGMLKNQRAQYKTLLLELIQWVGKVNTEERCYEISKYQVFEDMGIKITFNYSETRASMKFSRPLKTSDLKKVVEEIRRRSKK